MACYNAGPFIGETLRSISKQTYRNIETVIVDDGSSDNSSKVIESFVGSGVRLIKQDNLGAAVARNVAFRNSRGEFVLFVDADDVIGPLHVEALLDRIHTDQGCIALSRWDRFRTNVCEAKFPARPTENDMSGPDWLKLDWCNARPMTQSGMLLLPRFLLDHHGGWDERLTLNDDFEFFARMISLSKGIRFAPAAKLYYRSAIPGSLSGRKSREASESAFLSIDLGTRHLLSVDDSREAKIACANILRDFEYAHFPRFGDLRAKARERVAQLGGSNLEPDGPPGFLRLKQFVGWRAARIVERAVVALRPSTDTRTETVR